MGDVDYHKARERMVEEQLVNRGITDRRVIEAMRRVPRHLFMDEGLRERAYGDYPLPIGAGQTISQPYMVALMSQSLGLVGHEKVLEIGTGSGYQTAILAELASRVFSIERINLLAQRARGILDSLGYHGVVIRTGDGTLGWKDQSPFDAIIVTAGAPVIPDSLREQLCMEGRMVVPVGDALMQVLCRFTRFEEGLRREDLGGCVFVKLIGKYGWGEESDL